MAASGKVILLMFYITLVQLSCMPLSADASSSSSTNNPVQPKRHPGVRRLLPNSEEDKPNHPPIKTETAQSKLHTKSSLNSDQLSPLKNATTLLITKPKKLTNSTSKSKATKSSSLTKRSPNLMSSSIPKNKTSTNKFIPPKPTTVPDIRKSTKRETNHSKTLENLNSDPKPKPTQPSWMDQEEEDDLVSDFRNLPSKFQQTLLPDLESISQTSKKYLTNANKQMTKKFKPLIGNKYASTTANFVSFTFIILPLIILSFRIKTYFSLQNIPIFINIYLSIYFSILSITAVVTGKEPLHFLFATSQSTYVGLQILQSLCYVVYLLLLLAYLALVTFSTKTGLGLKLLALVQMIVGISVGLHYYVKVFHRVVTHQAPKTSWKVHAVYATCFIVISLFASVERRKKEYLAENGEEGKKN